MIASRVIRQDLPVPDSTGGRDVEPLVVTPLVLRTVRSSLAVISITALPPVSSEPQSLAFELISPATISFPSIPVIASSKLLPKDVRVDVRKQIAANPGPLVTPDPDKTVPGPAVVIGNIALFRTLMAVVQVMSRNQSRLSSFLYCSPRDKQVRVSRFLVNWFSRS